MNELLTAGLTVFGGAVVLVVGQIIQRFYLEPIQEQRRIIGEIAYALIYDANVVHEFFVKNVSKTPLRVYVDWRPAFA